MSVLTGEQKEHMERWIVALRSGNYKQGKRYLKKGDSYCCLGVLCDLEKEVVGGEFIKDNETDVAAFHHLGGNYLGAPPIPVRNLVRLDANIMDDLMFCNDSGISFEKIAEYLEKYYILGTTTQTPFDYLLSPISQRTN